MGRLVFSFMDENGELAVHGFALLAGVSVGLSAALRTGPCQTGVGLRGAGGEQRLATYE